MSLRLKLADLLWRASIALVPPPKKNEVVPTLTHQGDISTSGVIEADDVPQQWSEHQEGNVIIAEPVIMTKHRRGEL